MPDCKVCRESFVPKGRNQYGVQVFCSKACRLAFAKTPEGRAANREALARYRKTGRGKETRRECQRRWAKTENGRASGLRNQKRRYRRKRAAGLCVGCGCRKKALAGHVFCRKHLLAMRQKYHDRKAGSARTRPGYPR